MEPKDSLSTAWISYLPGLIPSCNLLINNWGNLTVLSVLWLIKEKCSFFVWLAGWCDLWLYKRPQSAGRSALHLIAYVYVYVRFPGRPRSTRSPREKWPRWAARLQRKQRVPGSNGNAGLHTPHHSTPSPSVTIEMCSMPLHHSRIGSRSENW